MKRLKTILSTGLTLALISTLFAQQKEPEHPTAAEFLVDYVTSTAVGGADQIFTLSPNAMVLDIKGKELKNPKELPIPCVVVAEFDNKGRIRFMRVVKVLRLTLQLNSPLSREQGRPIYKVVDSLPFKSLADLKKMAPVGRPIVSPTKPDSMLKIKPLPR